MTPSAPTSASLRPTTTAEGLTAEVRYGTDKIFAQLSPEWWELWRRSEKQDPFCRPDWVAAHINSFEKSAEFFAIAAHERGKLVALLPLLRDIGKFNGFPVRRIRAVENAHTWRVEPLMDPGLDAERVMRVLWRSVASLPGWDVVKFPNLSLNIASALARLATEESEFRAFEDPGLGSTFIVYPPKDTADPGEPWLRSVSSNMRHNLRRRRRKLEESLGRCTLVTSREYRSAMLESLFKIEASGWKGQAGTAMANQSTTREFYEDIARRLAATGDLFLHLLRAGDREIAAAITVRYGKSFFPLKWGYDDELKAFAPGNLLTEEMLRDAYELGFENFDISPDAEYKHHWTKDIRPRSTLYIFRGFYGRSLFWQKRRLRPLLKKILNRKPTVTG